MHQVREMARHYGVKLGLTGAALLSFVNNAVAAVPAEVTTAITDMKADALTVAAGFLVAFIAVTAFLYMRKGAR